MGLPLHTRVLEKPLKILYFGPKDKFNEACHTIGGKIGKKRKKVLRQPNLTVKSFSLERTLQWHVSFAPRISDAGQFRGFRKGGG